MKKMIFAEVLALAEPHFIDSGYNKHLDPSKGILGPKRPLRLYRPKTSVSFNEGFVLTDLLAITEDGVITDAFGGGCVMEGYERFPIEDLLMLKRWAQKEFRKLSLQSPSVGAAALS